MDYNSPQRDKTPPPNLNTFTQSTPIRRGVDNGFEGLKALVSRANLSAAGKIDCNMLLHLPPYPSSPSELWSDSLPRLRLVSSLIQSHTPEPSNYWKIIHLLNSISRIVHSDLTSSLSEKKSLFAICFTTCHTKTGQGDYLDSAFKPDMCGFKTSLKLLEETLQKTTPAALAECLAAEPRIRPIRRRTEDEDDIHWDDAGKGGAGPESEVEEEFLQSGASSGADEVDLRSDVDPTEELGRIEADGGELFLERGDVPEVSTVPSNAVPSTDGEAIQKTLPPAPPLSLRTTPIEDKRRGSQELQARQYCDTQKRYRPDLSNVYCLGLSGRKYQLHSSGTNGPQTSSLIPLTDLKPLYRYVLAAYNAELTRDCNRMAPHTNCGGQSWKFKVNNIYIDVAPFFAGSARGRMTWVGVETPLMNRVVKVSWHDTRRRYKEYDLYERLHRDTWVDGVARMASYAVETDLEADREKTCVVLGSVGDPLSECKTLDHFLCVMYDMLEAHQHMCERKVLHRDLSWHNVQCNPRHWEGLPSKQVEERACISKILHRPNPASQVLIIDLDHASEYEPGRPREEAHVERTGTPMFMAIEVAMNGRNHSADWQPRRFKLRGLIEFLEMQIEGLTSEEQEYLHVNQIKKIAGALRTHMEDEDFEIREPEAHAHHPRHDVESAFWILLWHLGRADDELNKDNNAQTNVEYQSFGNMLLSHKVNCGAASEDGRHALRGHREEDEYHSLFHPSLGVVVPTIRKMALYLAVDWRRCKTSLPACHAHLVMKLLLFRLLRGSDLRDIQLSNVPRRLELPDVRSLPSSSSMYSSGTSLKRGGGGEGSNPQATKRRKLNIDIDPAILFQRNEFLRAPHRTTPEIVGAGKVETDLMPKAWQVEFAGEKPSQVVDDFRTSMTLARRRWFGSGGNLVSEKTPSLKAPSRKAVRKARR